MKQHTLNNNENYFILSNMNQSHKCISYLKRFSMKIVLKKMYQGNYIKENNALNCIMHIILEILYKETSKIKFI